MVPEQPRTCLGLLPGLTVLRDVAGQKALLCVPGVSRMASGLEVGTETAPVSPWGRSPEMSF